MHLFYHSASFAVLPPLALRPISSLAHHQAAPVTSTASAPLAGPDVKTAARFRRRCGKRYAASKIISILLAMTIIACSAQELPASYCATVAASGKSESLRLVALFDEYATTKQVRADKSSPTAVIYYNEANTVDFGARLEFGTFGSVVTLFSRDNGITEDEVQSLEAFMQSTVKNEFAVTQCTELKDFKTPTRIGWPQHEKAA